MLLYINDTIVGMKQKTNVLSNLRKEIKLE